MAEWWTYRPEDFLLFSERVYWRLFELQNAAVWPWPVVALLLGATIPFLAWLRRPVSDRLVLGILAVAWLAVAWTFFWNQYRTVNWAAAYVAPIFVLEAVLLALFSSVRNGPWFGAARSKAAVLGWALFIYALALHPLVAILAGRPFQAAEVFAVAPDPTAIATLGAIAATRGGRGRLWLLPVPLAWCGLSFATLWTMGASEAWLPFAAAIVALFVLLLTCNSDRLHGPSIGAD